MADIYDTFRDIGIIPVVAIEDASKAADLAHALVKGGLPASEVTFRTACAAEAVPVELVTLIVPVEYINGLPAPPVDKIQLEHETVPSPLSVANVAQDPPVEEIVMLFAVILPP